MANVKTPKQVELASRLALLRQTLEDHESALDVYLELGLSERTYYRDLAKLPADARRPCACYSA